MSVFKDQATQLNHRIIPIGKMYFPQSFFPFSLYLCISFLTCLVALIRAGCRIALTITFVQLKCVVEATEPNTVIIMAPSRTL